jgi:hypothetical protein
MSSIRFNVAKIPGHLSNMFIELRSHLPSPRGRGYSPIVRELSHIIFAQSEELSVVVYKKCVRYAILKTYLLLQLPQRMVFE